MCDLSTTSAYANAYLLSDDTIATTAPFCKDNFHKGNFICCSAGEFESGLDNISANC